MKTILIVDDIPQNLYLLEIMLKTNGYAVEKAANGIEALELAHKDPPDMVVSDILMPGMDGFSLCRTWKADDQLKGIPFVFYTATYTDHRDEQFALNLGADRFMVKPMEPDAFLAALQELFEKHETMRAVAQQGSSEEETGFYKEYNSALIRKLEKKMLELQRSNNRLASLYQASCDLHILKPSSDLIEIILHTIVEVAGYKQANYFCYDQERNILTLMAAVGFSDESMTSYKDRLVFNLGETQGLVGFVAQNGQTINIPNTFKDPNWIALDTRILSALFTPVNFENNLLGVIALFSQQTDAFTEEDEHDIAVLANNLAIAVVNNQNQEKINKQLDQMSALHDIDIAINSSLGLPITLDIFLEHVTTQLKMDAANILLFHMDDPVCSFATRRGFHSGNFGSHNLPMVGRLARIVASEPRIYIANGITDLPISDEIKATWSKEGFSTYIGAPLIAKDEVVGVLAVFNRTPFNPDQEWLDYFETLTGQAAIAIDNAQMFTSLKQSNAELILAYDATITGWSRAMDLRDKETEGHTLRVTEMSVDLARVMGFSDEQLVHMRRGALLHDIGKLGVPDSILFKDGKLTDGEWVIMRKHPQFAYEMLLPIDYLAPALDVPYCHHEKWDGTGYPRGLKGEQIPLAGRLFAIVDVWDALRSDRPYRKAWSEEQALDYIKDQSDKQFDPIVVKKFLSLVRK